MAHADLALIAARLCLINVRLTFLLRQTRLLPQKDLESPQVIEPVVVHRGVDFPRRQQGNLLAGGKVLLFPSVVFVQEPDMLREVTMIQSPSILTDARRALASDS